MLFAADFRKIARMSLRGHWGTAILTGFLALLLGGSVGGSAAFNLNMNIDEEHLRFFSQWGQTEHAQRVFPFLAGAGIALTVWSLVVFVIGGAISLGYARYNLNLIDEKPSAVDDIFSDFRIGAGFCMKFLQGLYIFLWSLLFVIPGIIAAYSYAMTPYIMTEHPEYGANEAIKRSKEMMHGNRMRLFCLQISFIGWAILSAFTFGIGALWLKPYTEAASAVFYREISGTVPSYQAGNYVG